MTLGNILETARLPIKVVLAGSSTGSWFEVNAVANGKAYGINDRGNAQMASLTESARILGGAGTAVGAPVGHYMAVLQKADGNYYVSDLLFPTLEAARSHYRGKTVVRLLTEVSGISLNRVG